MSATAITNRPSVLCNAYSNIFSTKCLFVSAIEPTAHYIPIFFDNFGIFGMFLNGIRQQKNVLKKAEHFFSPYGEKWSRKNILKFLHPLTIYLIERRSFGQKYKFSNKKDMVSTWRNFKNIFSRSLFTIFLGQKC